VRLYHLRIAGPDDEDFGVLDLECDDDAEAIRLAARAQSPHGHSLWRGAHLLGWFEPASDREIEPDADAD
jgi:hypothetical protein